jgi:Common central domain of tyrosinase/Polyphenol oxidase middle domain
VLLAPAWSARRFMLSCGMVHRMGSRVRTRCSIWNLERTNPWEPYTLAYARAVEAMRKRPASDPTSWEFQAGIHGTSCQHQTWYFLPWHRLYISWFERIVQALVTKQSGAPSDWALPYWDWQADRPMPPAFLEPELPSSAGGGANPLYLEDRDPDVNRGAALAPAVVGSTAADSAFAFSGGAVSGFGFGGGDTHGPSHFEGGQTGLIEAQPHNNVHRTIAGIMGTALSPGDPIFWLHHAQVDRLWVRWLEKGGGRADPAEDRWLNQPYEFYDAQGSPVTQTPAEALSTTSLGYRYEDQAPLVSLPLSAISRELAEAVSLRMADVAGPGGEPRDLGESGPVRLGASATAATIQMASAPQADLRLLATPGIGPRSVALVLEDIQLADPDTASYEVYLNLPELTEGGQHQDPHFVGFLEFFGADHAHTDHDGRSAGDHGDEGLRRVFDITSVVSDLDRRGIWDPQRASVTFVPARVLEDPESGELLPPPVRADPDVRIGRTRIVIE